MRFAYLSAPLLGLLLVGCGPDDDRDREVTPPQPTTQQPAAPTSDTPPTNTGTGENGTTGAGTAGDVQTDRGTGVANPGAMDNSDTGSGLGTESGTGTEPNPAGDGR